MKLKPPIFPEITPRLILSDADIIVLENAARICEHARKLTTDDTDDESSWADAQLALLEVIEESKQERKRDGTQ